MLNTLFAHGLYDFAIQNKGKWESGVKENFGEKELSRTIRQSVIYTSG